MRIRVHPRAHVAAVVRALLIEHDQLVGGSTGSFRSRIWSISVKIAVLAPMPSASDRMATVAEQRAAAQAADGKAEVGKDGGHAGCLDGVGLSEVCTADRPTLASASCARASMATHAVSLRRMRAPYR